MHAQLSKMHKVYYRNGMHEIESGPQPDKIQNY